VVLGSPVLMFRPGRGRYHLYGTEEYDLAILACQVHFRLVHALRAGGDVEVIRKASRQTCKHPQKPGDGGRVAECSGDRPWLLGVYLGPPFLPVVTRVATGADLVALPGRRDGQCPLRWTEQTLNAPISTPWRSDGRVPIAPGDEPISTAWNFGLCPTAWFH
jgi:hypothetical protein